MSTPAKALEPVSQRNVSIVTAENRQTFESAFRQSVQERAYQLFERQGSAHGQHQAHWQQAEQELLQFAPPVHESGAWSTASVSLQNADSQNIQVLVLEDRATVAIANPPAYLLIRWPNRVDPATAAAYLKGNMLVVTAKHSAAGAEALPQTAVPATAAPESTEHASSATTWPEPERKNENG